MIVEDVRAEVDHLRVGVQTQRKALMMLQGILRRAVVRGLIPSPARPRRRRSTPLARNSSVRRTCAPMKRDRGSQPANNL
jgi:hypothetical protein